MYVHVCMYVCVCVCVHVRVSVRMCVCVHRGNTGTISNEAQVPIY